MNHKTALAAKVAAVNHAHQMARDLYPVLVAAFRPFYGEKVIKTNGDLLAKVEAVLPKLPGWGDTNNRACVFRLRSSSYSICYTVKASENYLTNGGCSSCYHEVSLFVCDLDGQNAKAPSGGGDWVLNAITNYTELDVLDKRARVMNAKRVYDEAVSALAPFGEYDR